MLPERLNGRSPAGINGGQRPTHDAHDAISTGLQPFSRSGFAIPRCLERGKMGRGRGAEPLLLPVFVAGKRKFCKSER
jgi:hypothetical protein